MFVKERALLHSLRINKAICNINKQNLSINAVNVSVKLYAAYIKNSLQTADPIIFAPCCLKLFLCS
jgi:hypothetical protein